jgi:hypothetical protein
MLWSSLWYRRFWIHRYVAASLFKCRIMEPSWLRPLWVMGISHLRSMFQFPVLKFRKLSVKSKVFQPPDLNWNTDVYLGIYMAENGLELPGYATDMNNL